MNTPFQYPRKRFVFDARLADQAEDAMQHYAQQDTRPDSYFENFRGIQCRPDLWDASPKLALHITRIEAGQILHHHRGRLYLVRSISRKTGDVHLQECDRNGVCTGAFVSEKLDRIKSPAYFLRRDIPRTFWHWLGQANARLYLGDGYHDAESVRAMAWFTGYIGVGLIGWWAV